MARQEQKKDVVIVGLGWTGSIMGIELAQEGLEIVALERGRDQHTVPEFKYPNQIDELKYGVRFKNMQHPSQQTVTVRRNLDETALPYRNMGSFLPANGVGGAGTHWNGHTWRPQEVEFHLRSYIRDRWGEQIIPEDMTIADYPVSYAELEPFFTRFDKVAGISGYAGNLNGQIREGGNPFEAPRSEDYPMPPHPATYDSAKFGEAPGHSAITRSRCPPASPRRPTRTPTGCRWGRATSAASANATDATSIRSPRRRRPFWMR
jgi:hypothetical protein